MFLQRTIKVILCIYEEEMTMATKNINIRVDEDLKKESEELFEDLGLSLSAAVKIFLKQSVRESAIPFEITLNKDSEQAFREVENNELETVHSVKELWGKLNED